ncbi:hypothetical protein [Sulfuriferula plumbiphila]|nr:hypothetical protein [Sulfuriferula plumbiphila]BBP05404.1 hypothetical protein SFPGR_28260 [Sulfuriferula plumbiphila]
MSDRTAASEAVQLDRLADIQSILGHGVMSTADVVIGVRAGGLKMA